MEKNFSIEEAYNQGWDIFKKNLWPSILIGIISFAIACTAQMITTAVTAVLFPVGMILMVGSFILNTILTMGAMSIYLKMTRGKNYTMAELFNRFDLIVPYIIITILFAAAFIAGLILLIIPGIIIAYMFRFSYLNIIDDNNGALNAMKSSREISKGIKWKLFAFDLVSIVLIFIGFLLLIVPGIIMCYIYTFGSYYIYTKLKEQTYGTVQENGTEEAENEGEVKEKVSLEKETDNTAEE